MIITTKAQLQTYKQAGQLSTRILAQLRDALKPGLLPIEIDQLAAQLCRQHKVKAAFKGIDHKGRTYNYHTCISINDTIVHGVPSRTKKIKTSDLVKLDFGLVYQGLYTDQCVTVSIGQPNPADRQLLLTAKKAVQQAIPLAITDNTTGDLGHIMQQTALAKGFDVLKQYTGHGIGTKLHRPPAIPAHGQPHTGEKLTTGMVLCLEAQLVAGSDEVVVAKDGWTVKVKDGKNTAMFEYLVVVGKTKPTILTPNLNWPIVV